MTNALNDFKIKIIEKNLELLNFHYDVMNLMLNYQFFFKSLMILVLFFIEEIIFSIKLQNILELILKNYYFVII